jgi:hypothetical protein
MRILKPLRHHLLTCIDLGNTKNEDRRADGSKYELVDHLQPTQRDDDCTEFIEWFVLYPLLEFGKAMNNENPNDINNNPNNGSDLWRTALGAQPESSTLQVSQLLLQYLQQQQEQHNPQVLNNNDEYQQQYNQPPMAITFPYTMHGTFSGIPQHQFLQVPPIVQQQLPLFTSQHQPQRNRESPAVFDSQLRIECRRSFNEREEFYMFIKIMFLFLERHENDNRLRQRAKAVVADCTRRNRMGEAGFTPLTEAVERRLRPTVGERYWTRSKDYLAHYMQRRGIQRGAQLNTAADTVTNSAVV